MTPQGDGALSGIRVLELSSYVTGPYAGVLLADLGAEVIKIEEPERGDPFRGWEEGNYSPTFCSVNRNKKSVALDLRSPAGQAAMAGLIATADVLLENYRPGVAERLGVGYDEARRLNSRLIYCAISGFGSSGPYRDRPGYDTVGQAMSGLLSLLTDLDHPQPMGISLSDHLTGIFACYGILAALHARQRTGEGQRVETSLLQATVAFLAENAARYFASGRVPSRESRTRLAQVYAFRAGDGLPFVIHLSSPPKFWKGLVEAIGRPDLGEDPRFRARAGRIEHYAELASVLGEVFKGAPRAVWLERLGRHDVPSAPVQTLEEAFADPQVQHLGMPIALDHPERGRLRLVGPGVTLEKTPVKMRLAPPLLGEHTEEVLKSLGMTAEQRGAASSRPRAPGAELIE
jgi:formyl-CoA transferase